MARHNTQPGLRRGLVPAERETARTALPQPVLVRKMRRLAQCSPCYFRNDAGLCHGALIQPYIQHTHSVPTAHTATHDACLRSSWNTLAFTHSLLWGVYVHSSGFSLSHNIASHAWRRLASQRVRGSQHHGGERASTHTRQLKSCSVSMYVNKSAMS